MLTKPYDSPRLTTICNKISAHTIADIGTDHAYIPINALLQNKCSRAVAGDVRSGPLEIARANVVKYNLQEKISLRLGSGLSVLSLGEADEIIIAGMGGMMIKDIIAGDIQKAASARRLILQPMNAAPDLRKFLFDNHFKISDEDIAVEGFKVYNVLVCEKGSESADEINLHIPPKLYSNRNFEPFINKKIREFRKIYSGIENSKNISPQNEADICKYKNLARMAEEIKKSVLHK